MADTKDIKANRFRAFKEAVQNINERAQKDIPVLAEKSSEETIAYIKKLNQEQEDLKKLYVMPGEEKDFESYLKRGEVEPMDFFRTYLKMTPGSSITESKDKPYRRQTSYSRKKAIEALAKKKK